MGPTHDDLTQHLAERRCWEVARRDDVRVARRVSRTHLGDGVSRLDEGAWLEDVVHVLPAIGVMVWLEEARGAAIPRQMVPVVQSVLRYGVQTRCGSERSHALPRRLCREEALMRLGGCKAQQVRQGSGPRGATTRQGERLPGPIGPDTLANPIVTWHVRALEAVGHGRLRAVAKAGVVGAHVTGMADGPALETTAQDPGGGQGTRTGRRAETRGRRHAIEGPVDGWTGLLRIDAATKMPWAGNGGQLQEPEARWTRALVTQARLQLQGSARRHQLVVDPGCLAGTTRWWLAQPESTGVGPATPNMAVTAEARAQAAADAGRTGGRRVHTGRQGQGHMARTARLETEVGGLTGLTTAAQEGTPAPGREPQRRAFQPHPINAVVVRTWRGKDDGPGGNTGLLTTAAVATP